MNTSSHLHHGRVVLFMYVSVTNIAQEHTHAQPKQSKICSWMEKILYWIHITIIIITVIKLFVKCKIFSVETILTHARSHAHEHASEHTNYTKFNLRTTWIGQQAETWDGWKTTRNGKRDYTFGKRSVIGLTNESRDDFSRRGKGRSAHGEEPKTDIINVVFCISHYQQQQRRQNNGTERRVDPDMFMAQQGSTGAGL